MQINEYQEKAHTFACYQKPVCIERDGLCHDVSYAYPALGLAEEAGEVAGKFAKGIRDECGAISEERKEAIKKELGDVCWFVAELSTLMGFTLEDVMQTNIDKLTSRKARNVIKGSGDNR